MTESERVALAWARKFLAGHHCNLCGGQWITGASTRVLAHRCVTPRRRGLAPIWSREAVIDEDRRRWAERQLGATPITGALEDALPPDALLLPVDEEEG